MPKLAKDKARQRRHRRVRKRLTGSNERPRLSVFRSNEHIYVQIIDDVSGRTMAAASTLDKEFKNMPDITDKKSAAAAVGRLIGKRALDSGIKAVVFDRGGFLYHGRIKALADGAREAGLEL